MPRIYATIHWVALLSKVKSNNGEGKYFLHTTHNNTHTNNLTFGENEKNNIEH